MQNLVQIACATCLVVATAADRANPGLTTRRGRDARQDTLRHSLWHADWSEHREAAAHDCKTEAKKHDWKMNIAVVDTHGELLAFERMDGARYASIAISQNKARTSARFRRETRVFYNQFETGHAYVNTLRSGAGGIAGRVSSGRRRKACRRDRL